VIPNSAAALLRLEHEALVRAAWILSAATDSQVQKLSTTLNVTGGGTANVPSINDMLAPIAGKAPLGLVAPLQEFHQSSRHASLGGMFVDRNGAAVNNITVELLNLAPLISYRFDSDPFTSCGRDFRPWVIADEAALRKLLEEGGKVELRRSSVLARADRFDVPVGTAAMSALSVPDPAAIAGATRKGNQRLLLRIVPAEQPSTGDFFVRVFVGLPSAGPGTSTDVPQYAGSFAFFNDPDAHGHHGPAGSESNAAFVVDVGATLGRLRASGAAVSGAAQRQPGRSAATWSGCKYTHAQGAQPRVAARREFHTCSRPLGASVVR